MDKILHQMEIEWHKMPAAKSQYEELKKLK